MKPIFGHQNQRHGKFLPRNELKRTVSDMVYYFYPVQ